MIMTLPGDDVLGIISDDCIPLITNTTTTTTTITATTTILILLPGLPSHFHSSLPRPL